MKIQRVKQAYTTLTNVTLSFIESYLLIGFFNLINIIYYPIVYLDFHWTLIFKRFFKAQFKSLMFKLDKRHKYIDFLKINSFRISLCHRCTLTFSTVNSFTFKKLLFTVDICI